MRSSREGGITMLVSNVFLLGQQLWAIVLNNCFFRFVYKDKETAEAVMANLKADDGDLLETPSHIWLESVKNCTISLRTAKQVKNSTKNKKES